MTTSHPAEPTPDAPGDLTRLLDAWARGDDDAAQQVFAHVHDALRRIARPLVRREAAASLEPTDLVHEVYLKFADNQPEAWGSRTRFLALAARAMRQILVDGARRRDAEKRGGGMRPLTLITCDLAPGGSVDILALHDALDQLAAEHPRRATVVELRFFGGLSVAEMAEQLKVSEPTIKRDWKVARMFLYGLLRR